MTGKESSKPVSGKAHLIVSLTTSSPKVSLSANPSAISLQLIATARIAASPEPTSAITFCTNKSILDNGQHNGHDGLFRGALRPLQSTTDPNRTIPIAFNGTPNYGSRPEVINLRDDPWMRFETVPPIGEGTLVIKHDLSLDRLFAHFRNLKAADVQPGERYSIGINTKRMFICWWWTLGDVERGDLKEKKFAKWVLPDEDGDIINLMPGEERPDIEQMEKDGWVFSQRLDNLEMTEAEEGNELVVEFVE